MFSNFIGDVIGSRYQYVDEAVAVHEAALREARDEFRPHSLIHSRRFFQKLGTAPGVAAWGYAYEGGVFNRA